MDSKSIAHIASVAGSIVEQNISLIEKIHSRIKFSRFIGTNLFFIFGFLFICGYVYGIQEYLKEYYIMFLLLPMVLALVFSVITKKYFSNTLIDNIILYLFLLSLEIIFGYLLYDSILELLAVKSSMDAVKRLLSILFVTLPFLIFQYSLYHISKNTAETAVQYFLKKDYEIILHLANSTEIKGTLITITKNNDYVIKIAGEQGETLVRYSSINVIKLY